MSNAHQLSPGILRFLYQQGWTSLRPIQEVSIPTVLDANCDALITASTAGGKTEACFLPVLSKIELDDLQDGFSVLVISPLKALINDQLKRLRMMGDSCGQTVTAWHGDIPANEKAKAWKAPKGVLIITPESLEGILMTRISEVPCRLGRLKYVVIDELHAFLGTNRGYQIISLLTRLERICAKHIPRIGLSATIGNPDAALKWLRPAGDFPGRHLCVEEAQRRLQLSLTTFSFPPKQRRRNVSVGEKIVDYLWPRIRGKTNLIFANARGAVEALTDDFNQQIQTECLQDEVFPHHGSLSKEYRRDVEQRLKCDRRPATAIATCTLELGIDIGSVHSVSQVCAPASVSSLKQRLGRSGRREGSPAILRLLLPELSTHPKAPYVSKFELQFVQTIAVLDLMLSGWVEPTGEPERDLSTLVQQVLALIVQSNGIMAHELYNTLCKMGPFQRLNPKEFSTVLSSLGESQAIQQLHSGELIVGLLGERLVTSHQFLAAFESVEEYQVIFNNKTLGTLPTSMMLYPGLPILFAGGRWIITAIEKESRSLLVQPHHRGEVPPYEGEAAPVHPTVRIKMREIFESTRLPAYLSDTAKDLLEEARALYNDSGLHDSTVLSQGGMLYLFVWDSDQVIETIARVLLAMEQEVMVYGPAIITDAFCDPAELIDVLLEELRCLHGADIARSIMLVDLGKFDGLLSRSILCDEYARRRLDVKGAVGYLCSKKCNDRNTGR